MSESSAPEERTEAPSSRRMSELRGEGAIHHSHELTQLLSLMTGFLVLEALWGPLMNGLMRVFKAAFTSFANGSTLNEANLQAGLFKVTIWVGPPVLILLVVTAAVASLVTMLQTKWNVKKKKIHFRFNMLNPAAGFKRVFSISGAVNTLKAILKLVVILPLAFFALRGFAPEMVMLVHLSVKQVLEYTGRGMDKLFWRIFAIFFVFAVFDFGYGKWQWLRQNKMTKDEVKDERKAVEGDEGSRRKIQAKGMERIMKRIKNSVRQADVIITNPTHFAVALKYERGVMGAPKVVAKGADHLAARIREIAREAGVPIIERRWLARALYYSVEVESEIPKELFRAVAEVLAYVYKLKRPARPITAAQ